SIEANSTQVLFTNQSDNDEDKFLPILFELRAEGINSEIYPDQVKWKRQMNFVTRKNIKFVVSSSQDGDMFLKNMETEEKTAFSTTKELVSLINK
ncbi:MAG: histidine--tRNA ligase, partial [Flavobacteriales bacterium]|nr:histidine--tRNA ligase [Flavobacteriales bacterium]